MRLDVCVHGVVVDLAPVKGPVPNVAPLTTVVIASGSVARVVPRVPVRRTTAGGVEAQFIVRFDDIAADSPLSITIIGIGAASVPTTNVGGAKELYPIFSTRPTAETYSVLLSISNGEKPVGIVESSRLSSQAASESSPDATVAAAPGDNRRLAPEAPPASIERNESNTSSSGSSVSVIPPKNDRLASSASVVDSSTAAPGATTGPRVTAASDVRHGPPAPASASTPSSSSSAAAAAAVAAVAAAAALPVVAPSASNRARSSGAAASPADRIAPAPVNYVASGPMLPTEIQGTGSALPCRLVDYFAVMVSDEDSEQPDGGSGGGAPNDGVDRSAAQDQSRHLPRRSGKLQFRRPKVDHADLAMPGHVDWFLFPDGLKPIVQPRETARPATQHSVFVLSNVGSGDGIGAKMYGVCLTAYRLEENGDEGDDSSGGSSQSVWWPVVLFMLTRYPIVPQLQVLLETVYNVYDAGASSGMLPLQDAPPSYCSLDDYLRMLIFETPVPIRRTSLDVSVFLPGPQPTAAADGMVTFHFPEPDSLPLMQFDAAWLLQILQPANLLTALAAAVLNKRMVIVGDSVQELTQAAEILATLMYPFQWDLPFIPVLPAHMAVDCLQAPVPFLYGMLAAYAAQCFGEVSAVEMADVVVVDLTTGNVDVGVDLYLARQRVLSLEHSSDRAGHQAAKFELDSMLERLSRLKLDSTATDAAGDAGNDDQYPWRATVSTASQLRFPASVQSLCVSELAALTEHRAESPAAPSSPAAAAASGADQVPVYYAQANAHAMRRRNAPIQHLLLRLFAAVLQGYRSAVWFPGLPPQFAPILNEDGISASPASRCGFIDAIGESQSFSRMLQRHCSVYLRPFHWVSSQTASGTLGDAKAVLPWASTIAYCFVVPPPGADSLQPWQAASHRPASSDAGTSQQSSTAAPQLPLLHAGQRKSTKEKKGAKADARKWLSGDVALASGMDAFAVSELESLVSSSVRAGFNGPHGDDVGADPELMDDGAIAEAAAVVAQAASSASTTRVRRKSSQKRRGFFGTRTRARTDTADADGGSDEQVMLSHIHHWLADCLTGTSTPDGTVADEKVADMFSSPVARAAFAKALQSQVMTAAGLLSPQALSAGGKLQLQPTLGLGTSLHLLAFGAALDQARSRLAAIAALANILSSVYLPQQRFQRLSSMCGRLLMECRKDKDYATASAMLQLSFLVFTSASALGARLYLIRSVAKESCWQQSAFWEAFFFAALEVEKQQATLQLQASNCDDRLVSALRKVQAQPMAVGNGVFDIISALLNPMLSLGVSAADVRAFVARACVKANAADAERSQVAALVETLLAADAGAAANSNVLADSSISNGTPKVSEPPPVQPAPLKSLGAVSKAAGAVPVARDISQSASQASTPVSDSKPPMAAASGDGGSSASVPVAGLAAPAAPASAPTPSASTSVASTPAAAIDDTSEPVSGATTPAVPPASEPSDAGPSNAASSDQGARVASTVSGAPPLPPKPPRTPAQPEDSTAAEAGSDADAGAGSKHSNPWSSLPIKEAEAQAAALVQARRFPPAPSSGHPVPSKAPADVSTAEIAFRADSVAGGTPNKAGGETQGPAAVPAATPQAAAAAAGQRKKLEITKAFGAKVGLSIVASKVTAAMQSVDDAVGRALDGDFSLAGRSSAHSGNLKALFENLSAAHHAQVAGGSGGYSTPRKGAVAMPLSMPMSCLAFKGHAPGAALTCMSFDSLDGRVATGGNDGRVCMWDMNQRTYIHAYTEHTAAVTAVRIAGDVIASASQDGTVRLSSFARLTYGLATSAPAASGSTEDGNDSEEEVAASEGAAAVSDSGGIVTPVKPAAPTPATPSSAFKDQLSSFGSKFGGKIIGLAPVAAAAKAVERGLHKFRSAIKLKGHSGPVTALDMWERPSENEQTTSWFGRKAADAPKRLLPSESHYVVVTGGADGSVRTWSAKWHVNKQGKASGTALGLSTHSNLHKSSSIIESVKLSVDGRLAVSAGRDGRIGVIDIVTGKVWVMMHPSQGGGFFKRKQEVAPIDPVSAPTTLPLISASVDVTHRPIFVTSAGTDGTARVWDLRSGAVALAFPSGSPIWCYTTVPGHGIGSPVLGAGGEVISPPAPMGDYLLLTGHEDGIVRKWDSRKHLEPMQTWVGHSGAVTSISAHGDNVVTGSADSTVRLWDAVTGSHVRCDGHSGQVSATAICEDYVLSAGWDGTLRCFQGDSDADSF